MVWNSHFNIRLTPIRILNIRPLVATCRISNFSFCEACIFLLCILLTIYTLSFFPLLESRFFVGKNATLRKPHCKWHSITHRCLKHRLTAEKKSSKTCDTRFIKYRKKDKSKYCILQTSWLEIVTLQNSLMVMNWI